MSCRQPDSPYDRDNAASTVTPATIADPMVWMMDVHGRASTATEI